MSRWLTCCRIRGMWKNDTTNRQNRAVTIIPRSILVDVPDTCDILVTYYNDVVRVQEDTTRKLLQWNFGQDSLWQRHMYVCEPAVHSCYALMFIIYERRLSLCRTLFKQITNQSNMLHYLLPAKSDAILYPGCDLWWNIQQFALGQTNLRILSYHIHSRTFSATCRLDCVKVLNV